MTRILPCPFCGREPDAGWLPNPREFWIACECFKCIVKPRVHHAQEAKVLRFWNRRNGVDLECIERDQQLIRNRGRV